MASTKAKGRPPRLAIDEFNSNPPATNGGASGEQGEGVGGSWETAAGLPPIHSPSAACLASPHHGLNPVLPQTIRSPTNRNTRSSPSHADWSANEGEALNSARSYSTAAKARGLPRSASSGQLKQSPSWKNQHSPRIPGSATANTALLRTSSVEGLMMQLSSVRTDLYGDKCNVDQEGFDPYSGTTGPAIYGGNVRTDPESGRVMIGMQYQNHNPTPGPIYDGTGYSDLFKAIQKGPSAVNDILASIAPAQFRNRTPSLLDVMKKSGGVKAVSTKLSSVKMNKDDAADLASETMSGGIHKRRGSVHGSYIEQKAKMNKLVNKVMTGGATVLHMCGMSEAGQHCTEIIIGQEANIEALDTYGLTPLHRMCINDYAVGAEALLKAGASPTRMTEAGAGSELRGKTPVEIARDNGAMSVLRLLRKYMMKNTNTADDTWVSGDTGPGESPASVSRFPLHSPVQKKAPARMAKTSKDHGKGKLPASPDSPNAPKGFFKE